MLALFWPVLQCDPLVASQSACWLRGRRLLGIQSNTLKSHAMLFNLWKGEAKIMIAVECGNAEKEAR
jgi:hypothetical protein